MSHGTWPAYRQHLADGEGACIPCLRFTARYEQQRLLDIERGLDRLVDKAPSLRKIHALQSIGWSTRSLAIQMGRNQSYLRVLGRKTQPRIKRSLAKEIDELYERLCMKIGPSTRARADALRYGWPPPLAWDDIEAGVLADKTVDRWTDRFDEVLIERFLLDPSGKDGYLLNPAEKAEVVRRWLASGRSESYLCRLTGWRPGRYRETPTRDEVPT